MIIHLLLLKLRKQSMRLTGHIRLYLITIILGTNIVWAQSVKEIAFGPYLQNMTYRSVTICWATLDGESEFTTPDGKIQTIREYKNHQMKLSRLKEKTVYTYDVLKNGSAEGKGSFKTFPRGIEPFNFVTLGDTRSRHDIHKTIVDSIMVLKPLFIVNTGDLVSNGDNIHDWEKFFEVNRDLMRKMPYFPVLGNHENDSKYYYDFFDLPGNERYYQFSVGDALFLILDSEGPDFHTPVYIREENREAFWENYNLEYFKQEKKWVENILALHQDAGYIFVFFHKPLISIKKSRLEGAKLRREFWGDIFKRYGVQVILNGHDHHYHHAYSEGTHYVTTAGGGAGLYETDAPQPETVIFKKIEHFVSVEVGLETATLKAIDINGEIIDSFTVSKRE